MKMLDNVKIITLTKEEQYIAKYIAKERTKNNKKKNTHNNWGNRDPYEIDLDGYGFEIVVCRVCNYYPDFSTHVRKGSPDCYSHKGDKIDAKCTGNPDSPLKVKTTKKKEDADIYILGVGKFPSYRILGWATAEEVFSSEVLPWGDITAYHFPQEDLKMLLIPDYIQL